MNLLSSLSISILRTYSYSTWNSWRCHLRQHRDWTMATAFGCRRNKGLNSWGSRDVLNKARLQCFAWIPWNIEQPHHRELCIVTRRRTKQGCCNVSCTHSQYRVQQSTRTSQTCTNTTHTTACHCMVSPCMRSLVQRAFKSSILQDFIEPHYNPNCNTKS